MGPEAGFVRTTGRVQWGPAGAASGPRMRLYRGAGSPFPCGPGPAPAQGKEKLLLACRADGFCCCSRCRALLPVLGAAAEFHAPEKELEKTGRGRVFPSMLAAGWVGGCACGVCWRALGWVGGSGSGVFSGFNYLGPLKN